MPFERVSLIGHKDSVNCLYARDNFLYSGSDDNTVRIWDLRTNKTVKCLTNFANPVDSICSHDNVEVYTASGDNILLYDLRASNGVIVQSSTSWLFNNGGSDINCIDIDDCGIQLVAGDDDGGVHVCDLSTFRISGNGSACVKTYREPHTSLVNSVLCGTSPGSFYSSGFDSLLCCWGRRETERAQDVRLLKQHLITTDVLLSTTLSNSTDRQLRQCVNPPFIHQLQYILPDRSAVACGIGNGSIKVYASNQNRGIMKNNGDNDNSGPDTESAVIAEAQSGLDDLSLHPSQGQAQAQAHAQAQAQGSSQGQGVDADPLDCEHELKLLCYAEEAHEGMVTALAALGTHTLLSTGIDGLVRTWSLKYDTESSESSRADGGSGGGSGKPLSASAARRKRRNKPKSSAFPSSHSHPVVMTAGAVLAHGHKINMMVGAHSGSVGAGVNNGTGENRFLIADVTPTISSCVFL